MIVQKLLHIFIVLYKFKILYLEVTFMCFCMYLQQQQPFQNLGMLVPY